TFTVSRTSTCGGPSSAETSGTIVHAQIASISLSLLREYSGLRLLPIKSDSKFHSPLRCDIVYPMTDVSREKSACGGRGYIEIRLQQNASKFRVIEEILKHALN